MTTKEDLSRWFLEGKRQKATHMIVVCDTFDHEDYPAYANGDADCLEKYDHYQNASMQRVMEVYDLRKQMAEQMTTTRVFNLPR